MRISDWSSDVCSSDLWAEVDHLYRIAARIGMARDEDGRVAQIILRRLDAAFEVDLPKSGRTFPTGRIVVQQRTEERIAVDARHASPHEPTRAVDQGRYPLGRASWWERVWPYL